MVLADPVDGAGEHAARRRQLQGPPAAREVAQHEREPDPVGDRAERDGLEAALQLVGVGSSAATARERQHRLRGRARSRRTPSRGRPFAGPARSRRRRRGAPAALRLGGDGRDAVPERGTADAEALLLELRLPLLRPEPVLELPLEVGEQLVPAHRRTVAAACRRAADLCTSRDDGPVPASSPLIRPWDPEGPDVAAVGRLVGAYLRQTEREKAAHLRGESLPLDAKLPARYRPEAEDPRSAYADATVEVAELDARIVGVLVLRPGDAATRITRLWVATDARGRGVGSALTDTAIAATAGPLRLSVWDWRSAALRLYGVPRLRAGRLLGRTASNGLHGAGRLIAGTPARRRHLSTDRGERWTRPPAVCLGMRHPPPRAGVREATHSHRSSLERRSAAAPCPPTPHRRPHGRVLRAAVDARDPRCPTRRCWSRTSRPASSRCSAACGISSSSAAGCRRGSTATS